MLFAVLFRHHIKFLTTRRISPCQCHRNAFIHQKTTGAFPKDSRKVYPSPFAVNLNANDKVWVEPDISIVCDAGKIDGRGCGGAPDWIIEIVSPSSTRMDYSVKLFKYRTAGVREYWVVIYWGRGIFKNAPSPTYSLSYCFTSTVFASKSKNSWNAYPSSLVSQISTYFGETSMRISVSSWLYLL